MLLADLVHTSERVTAAAGRLEKIALLADLLGQLDPGEVEIATAFLCGTVRQSRLGVGPVGLPPPGSGVLALTLGLRLDDVDAAFEHISRAAGKGSAGEKRRILQDLWVRAGLEERRFLARLILGELRQGALEGVVLEAVARAAGVPAAAVRRALMTAGDLPVVARVALREGEEGLARFTVQVFRPLLPMLAETAEDVTDALKRLGRAALEYKLDGARIQVHKDGDRIRVNPCSTCRSSAVSRHCARRSPPN